MDVTRMDVGGGTDRGAWTVGTVFRKTGEGTVRPLPRRWQTAWPCCDTRCLLKYTSGCVCVCPPLDKGFSTATPSMLFNYLCQPPYTSRGCKQPIQSCTNEDTGCVLVISIWDAKSTYLQSSSHAVTPIFHFLFHGSSRFPPHKHSSPAAEQPVRFPPLASANIVQQYCFS